MLNKHIDQLSFPKRGHHNAKWTETRGPYRPVSLTWVYRICLRDISQAFPHAEALRNKFDQAMKMGIVSPVSSFEQIW